MVGDLSDEGALARARAWLLGEAEACEEENRRGYLPGRAGQALNWRWFAGLGVRDETATRRLEEERLALALDLVLDVAIGGSAEGPRSRRSARVAFACGELLRLLPELRAPEVPRGA